MIPWNVAALDAALVWGIHYPLIDFALKHISLITVLLLTAVPVLLLVPFYRHILVADARALAQLGSSERWTVLSEISFSDHSAALTEMSALVRVKRSEILIT